MTSATVLQARELRKNPTPEEAILWQLLKTRTLNGFKFRRQHPMGKYIADFCCPEVKLIIELDGRGHDAEDQKEYDRMRSEYLQARHYRILRIRNHELRADLEVILQKIQLHLL